MITFKTHEERMQHPQAKRIPESIWNELSLFNGFLDEWILPLMTADLEELPEHLSHHAAKSEKPKKLIWLAIAFSHPKCNLTTLRQIATSLGFNRNNLLFHLLVLLGNKTNLQTFTDELANSNSIQKMIAGKQFSCYQWAAKFGHLEILHYLEKKAPEQIQAMIAAKTFAAYRLAAENGHLEILKYLEEKYLGPFQDMIAPIDFYAYRLAAEKGHFAILKHLEKKAPDQIHAMIAANNFYAYRLAAEKGHFAILKHLEKKAPGQIQGMIAANDFYAYRSAAENGHLEGLKHFEKKAPEQIQGMIAAIDFYAYREAAENGHLEVLKHLEKKAPNQIQAMIATFDFYAYQEAATNGHLEVLKHLEEEAPDQIQAMIAANEFYAYVGAAANGHLEVLKHLEEKAPDQMQAMIAANEFYAYVGAATNGHLEVLKHLEEKAPDQMQAMIAANEFYAYQWAFGNNHLEIARRMLAQNSACFSYAERRAQYSGQIKAFIQEMLANLRHLAAAISVQEVFDIPDSGEQAKICFFIMRHLIRLNDRTYDDDLCFLLGIPAIRALVHQEVEGQANELLRLALSQNNQQAANLLLGVPAVRELAEQNDNYREEVRGHLDLGQLARDHESAMIVLTRGEQERLEEAIKHYQPMLDKEGVPRLMNKLREELSERYQANPTTIQDQHGKTISLPMDFTELQKTKLNPKEYNLALKAYYQHKDHSAWRYLANPNPWMNPNASYVYVNNNRTERWSTFEEFQPLITMLWLAAHDAQIPPIDGQTLKSRVDHFIEELAHIGRAHNWDNTRLNAQGNEEEYDDLSGDRPSCNSGVKRRLFQSVLGHPFLSLLTQESLLEEIRTFVRDYFAAQIHPHQTIPLKKAFEDYFINTNDLSETSKVALASLNITKEKQQEFNHYLRQKYGAQYAEDRYFHKLVIDNFALKLDSKELFDHYHALKLDGLAGLYTTLLKASSPKMPKLGFFQTHDNKPDVSKEAASTGWLYP